MTAHEKIRRGYDSSGRPLYATRQSFQRYDRINEALNGRLVIVQGAFNQGVSASAGTHDLAGAFDFRTWNLTSAEQYLGVKTGRELGGADWLRTSAQGFDPHWHGITIGDTPMHPATFQQVQDYINGLNGLASKGRDDFPFRPEFIRPYQYIEDDMYSDEDRARDVQAAKDVAATRKALAAFRSGEWQRDLAEAERSKERFSQVVTLLGKAADQIGVAINAAKDDATKADLRKAKNEILQALADHPDVDGADNPA